MANETTVQKKEEIAVVDDEFRHLCNATEEYDSQGYLVRPFADFVSFAEYFKRNIPKAVITDMRFPYLGMYPLDEGTSKYVNTCIQSNLEHIKALDGVVSSENFTGLMEVNKYISETNIEDSLEFRTYQRELFRDSEEVYYEFFERFTARDVEGHVARLIDEGEIPDSNKIEELKKERFAGNIHFNSGNLRMFLEDKCSITTGGLKPSYGIKIINRCRSKNIPYSVLTSKSHSIENLSLFCSIGEGSKDDLITGFETDTRYAVMIVKGSRILVDSSDKSREAYRCALDLALNPSKYNSEAMEITFDHLDPLKDKEKVREMDRQYEELMKKLEEISKLKN